MTNMRQRKQIFGPIAARNPDTALIAGRFLVVKPVRHIVRRVLMETTYLADFTNLEWNVSETFAPQRDLLRGLGHYGFHCTRDPPGTDFASRRDWQWSDPTMVADLVATIETEALPALRGLDTLERYVTDFRNYFKGTNRERQVDRLTVDIALGDLDAARATYAELMPRYQRDFDIPYYRAERAHLLEIAEPLRVGDRRTLAAMLHAYEAANIRGTPLEPHWEPSPFPIETRAGLA